MSGTITGELRSLMQRYDNFADVEMVMLEGTDFDRLCDAIDAVHANLERENESLRRELDRVLGEQEDCDGWVRLPVDADGVPIRVGDVMKGEKVGGGFGEPFEIVGYIMSNGELEPMDEHKLPRKRKYAHHHHAPTVEDLLFSYGQACIRASNEAETDAAKQTMLAMLREDYAAKLRLAEGEDA